VTRRRRGGFTLLEALFTVVLMAMVMTFVMNFYFDITHASERTTRATREIRSATAVVDRVARDLEGAYFVRPEPDAQDPLEQPWFFLAERGDAFEGAGQVRFTTLSHRVAPGRAHQSDLATISYLLEDEGDGRFALLRHVSPRIPDGIDPAFPRPDDPGVSVVADDLASFSLRFQDEAGVWSDEWDSSLGQGAGELPLVVEIDVALEARGDEVERAAALAGGDAPAHYRRRVALLQRPIDQDIALGLGSGGAVLAQDPQQECEVTWAECMARQPPGKQLADQPEAFRTWFRINSQACHGWDPSNLTPTYDPTLCLRR